MKLMDGFEKYCAVAILALLFSTHRELRSLSSKGRAVSTHSASSFASLLSGLTSASSVSLLSPSGESPTPPVSHSGRSKIPSDEGDDDCGGNLLIERGVDQTPLTLAYNSLLASTNLGWGNGWRSNFDEAVEQSTAANGSVSYELTDGEGTTIDYSVENTVNTALNYWPSDLRLSRSWITPIVSSGGSASSATSLTRSFLSGEVHSYSPFTMSGSAVFLLTNIAFPNGRTIAISRNAQGYIDGIRDSLKGQTQITLNGSGLIASVSYPAQSGVVTRFSYDQNNNLTTKTFPGSALSESYTYFPTSNLLGALTDVMGNTTLYRYFSNNLFQGLVTPQNHSYQLSLSPTTCQKTMLEGMITHTFSNHLLSRTNDIRGWITSYTRDTLGRITTIYGSEGNESFAYGDGTAFPISVRDFDGASHSLQYDQYKNLLSDSTLGDTRVYTYDGLYNLVSVSINGVTAFAAQYSQRSPSQVTLGDGTSFSFGSQGMLNVRTDPSGAKTSYSYDAQGNVIGANTSGYPSVSYSRDLLGRMTGLTLQGGGSGPLMTLSESYDELGRNTSTSVTTAGGASVTENISYDDSPGSGETVSRTASVGGNVVDGSVTTTSRTGDLVSRAQLMWPSSAISAGPTVSFGSAKYGGGSTGAGCKKRQAPTPSPSPSLTSSPSASASPSSSPSPSPSPSPSGTPQSYVLTVTNQNLAVITVFVSSAQIGAVGSGQTMRFTISAGSNVQIIGETSDSSAYAVLTGKCSQTTQFSATCGFEMPAGTASESGHTETVESSSQPSPSTITATHTPTFTPSTSSMTPTLTPTSSPAPSGIIQLPTLTATLTPTLTPTWSPTLSPTPSPSGGGGTGGGGTGGGGTGGGGTGGGGTGGGGTGGGGTGGGGTGGGGTGGGGTGGGGTGGGLPSTPAPSAAQSSVFYPPATLNWPGLSNANSYFIKRSASAPNGATSQTLIRTTQNKFVDPSAIPGTTVTYSVQASNSDGVSNWSGPVSVFFGVSPITPPAPTQIVDAQISGNQVALNWNLGYAANAVLIIGTSFHGGPTTWWPTIWVPASVSLPYILNFPMRFPNGQILNPSVGTTISFGVAASNAPGVQGPWGGAPNINFQSSGSYLPTTPANVAATYVPPNGSVPAGVRITWNVSDANGVMINRSLDGGTTWTNFIVPGAGTSYVDTLPYTGVSVQYGIRGYNTKGFSPAYGGTSINVPMQ